MRPADPVLHSFRRCPYAIRARLALAMSGAPCEVREVKLAAKPASMIEASPKGTVPVLVLPDGTVIDESLNVMRWALAAHDPEHWLARDDPALIAANDGAFKHDLDRYKYPERYGSDPMTHRDAALTFVRLLDERLASGPQLCGVERGLADMAILPFVRQFAAVDREWFVAQPLAHLQAWLERHLASALFHSVMLRLAPWNSGDEPAVLFGA